MPTINEKVQAYIKGIGAFTEGAQRREAVRTVAEEAANLDLPVYGATDIGGIESARSTLSQGLQQRINSRPGVTLIDDFGIARHYPPGTDPLEDNGEIDYVATRMLSALQASDAAAERYNTFFKRGLTSTGVDAGISYLESEQLASSEAERAYQDYIRRISDLSALESIQAEANQRISDAYQQAIDSEITRREAGGNPPFMGFAATPWDESYDPYIEDLRSTIPEEAPQFRPINPSAYAPGAGARGGGGYAGGGIVMQTMESEAAAPTGPGLAGIGNYTELPPPDILFSGTSEPIPPRRPVDLDPASLHSYQPGPLSLSGIIGEAGRISAQPWVNLGEGARDVGSTAADLWLGAHRTIGGLFR